MKTLAFALVAVTVSCLSQPVTDFVDPFIGTGSYGRTFPGAVRPWGMVSVSPHTAPGSPSGYIWGSPHFHGFGHVHLSGTGCADLGSVLLTVVRGTTPEYPGETKCSYGSEAASPGYYRATLHEPGIHAEVTAAKRSGFSRFTSFKSGNITVLLNAGTSLALEGGGSVRILPGGAIEGYAIAGGFCGEANRQMVYFYSEFSRASVSSGTWKADSVFADSAVSAIDVPLGAWLRFAANAGEELLVRVGISYVSIRNARMNLAAEIPHWDFDRTRSEAQAEWESSLSRVVIDDPAGDDHTKFYTALYHTLIHPNIISDVNGEYPLMGRKGIGRYQGRERYTVFSLWDTYRTLHPLLTLLFPERASHMVQTMVDMYLESGWLPKWELAGNETLMMVGDPAVAVIADTYLKGVRDFDVQTAYEAIKKHAHESSRESGPVRPGYHEQMRYGYIPFEQDTTENWWVWGPVSNTLEYCLADWSFSQLAASIGKSDDAREFHRRSLLYKNVFDTVSLFMRPKLRNGTWLEPFNPLATEGSGSWEGSGGPGFVEGNAWNYTWFVPHDIPGLTELFGGKDRFVEKLNQCFAGGHFTIGNEPDIAYPYLFSYFPETRHLAGLYAHKIMRSGFGTGPDGLSGNDDAGTISAWFVFSALGFYPDCPGSNDYRLGRPLFRSATIQLNHDYYAGRKLIIKRTDSDTGSRTMLGRRPLTSGSVDHEAITAGGTLLFEVSAGTPDQR